MMPGLPGYLADNGADAQAFDVEAAKQLLAESKYGGADGLGPIVLTEIGRGATAGDTIRRSSRCGARTSA